MIRSLKKLNFSSDNLIKHAGIMFVTSIFAGIFNYSYQIFMGRALGPEEYSIFGALFAISYIISIIASTIQTSIARFVSKFIGEKKNKKIRYLIKGSLKRMFLLGITIFLFISVFSTLISSFLKINTVFPVIIMGSVFLFATLLPVNLGALQGLQKFVILGSNRVINYASKLIFGIIFVSIGFGVCGALGAVVIGAIIALLISLIPLKNYIINNDSKKVNFKFLEVYRYSLPALLAMFCFTVPTNVDVIIVKHFFSANNAGIYTAVSVLGKIILFIPGAVVAVMFPKVTKSYSEKKDTTHILLISLISTGILSGILALGYWFFPFLVVKIPFGIEYIEAVPLLQLYGLAMLFFSLSVVLMRYSLAIHDNKYIYLLALFTFFEIGFFTYYHMSLLTIIWIILIFNILLFFCGIFYIFYRIFTLNNVKSD